MTIDTHIMRIIIESAEMEDCQDEVDSPHIGSFRSFDATWR